MKATAEERSEEKEERIQTLLEQVADLKRDLITSEGHVRVGVGQANGLRDELFRQEHLVKQLRADRQKSNADCALLHETCTRLRAEAHSCATCSGDGPSEDDCPAQLADVTKKLREAETYIDQIVAAFNTLKAQTEVKLKERGAALEANEVARRSLATDLGAAHAAVTESRHELASAKANVSSLDTALASAHTAATSAQRDLTHARAQFTELAAQATAAKVTANAREEEWSAQLARLNIAEQGWRDSYSLQTESHLEAQRCQQELTRVRNLASAQRLLPLFFPETPLLGPQTPVPPGLSSRASLTTPGRKQANSALQTYVIEDQEFRHDANSATPDVQAAYATALAEAALLAGTAAPSGLPVSF